MSRTGKSPAGVGGGHAEEGPCVVVDHSWYDLLVVDVAARLGLVAPHLHHILLSPAWRGAETPPCVAHSGAKEPWFAKMGYGGLWKRCGICVRQSTSVSRVMSDTTLRRPGIGSPLGHAGKDDFEGGAPIADSFHLVPLATFHLLD